MATEQLNLHHLHGRDRIFDHFDCAPASTAFLKDFAFNENKTIRQASSTGSQKKWVRANESCSWMVNLSLKRPSSQCQSKLASIPAKSWFVSKLNLNHKDTCASFRKCTPRQLLQLTDFKAALVESRDSARARVAASLKQVNQVNVGDQPAAVYRAIEQGKEQLDDASPSVREYKHLVSYLVEFECQNVDSRACCQLDSRGRFYRAFLSIGSLIENQDKWFPVLECDGTHMKNPRYSGVCLTPLGKDGDGRNVPAVVAYVHKETRGNFAWFFANSIAAGLLLSERVIFTDGGHQREAQAALADMGIKINLKFCSLHISFNTIDRFKSTVVVLGTELAVLYQDLLDSYHWIPVAEGRRTPLVLATVTFRASRTRGGNRRGGKLFLFALIDNHFAFGLRGSKFIVIIASAITSTDPDIERVSGFIYRVQTTTTIEEYEAVLDRIRQAFPVPIHPGTDKEQFVFEYLRDIHSISWTQFGNFVHTPVEKLYLETYWQPRSSYGKPLPLHGVRTTSVNEGENNAMLWNCMRDQLVPRALLLFSQRVVKITTWKKECFNSWPAQKCNVTPKHRVHIYVADPVSQESVITDPTTRQQPISFRSARALGIGSAASVSKLHCHAPGTRD